MSWSWRVARVKRTEPLYIGAVGIEEETRDAIDRHGRAEQRDLHWSRSWRKSIFFTSTVGWSSSGREKDLSSQPCSPESPVRWRGSNRGNTLLWRTRCKCSSATSRRVQRCQRWCFNDRDRASLPPTDSTLVDLAPVGVSMLRTSFLTRSCVAGDRIRPRLCPFSDLAPRVPLVVHEIFCVTWLGGGSLV